MSLHDIIKHCCAVVREELDEHDPEDVLVCVKRDHADEIREHVELHTDKVLRDLIRRELKREAGTEHTDSCLQLEIAGIEKIPASLSFYDGNRVRFISTMKARAEHFRSAIKLREDAAGYSAQMARKLRTLLDLLESHGGGETATLGDALIREPITTRSEMPVPDR